MKFLIHRLFFDFIFRRVHITEATYELVKDTYNVENGEGEKRSDYIKDQKIKTFLVCSRKNQEQESLTVRAGLFDIVFH